MATKAEKELKDWAEGLLQEVYNEWKKYDWPLGFGVFYGPVYRNPELMIISLNPGSKGGSFHKEELKKYEEGVFSLPTNAPYQNQREHLLANRIRDLFEHKEDFLQKSVTFPLIFFRSADEKILKKELLKKHPEIKQFCYDKVTDIINEVTPKRILIIGITTHSKLKRKILKIFTIEKVLLRAKNNNRLAIRSVGNKIPMFSIAHPSGYHIRENDWQQIKKLFGEWMENK